MKQAHGRRAETMCWPDPLEEPSVKSTILEDDAAARIATELWTTSNECMVRSGTWTWWTDRSRTDSGRVAAAV